MPRKRPQTDVSPLIEPLSLRISGELSDRLDRVARVLNLDRSALIRLLLAESLPFWEKRIPLLGS